MIKKKKIGFKGSSCFYKNIKDGCTTLAKVEKDPPKTKFDINEILKGRYKSKDQQSAKKNIKTLYESQRMVIFIFDDYSKFASKVKYRSIYGEGLKILTPKQTI